MWFIIALVVGVALTALVFWLRNRSIGVKWYEWLIGAVGLILLLFAIQNSVTAALIEWEQSAAWMFVLLTGVPAVILLALAWILARRRHSAAG